ncbi:MAG TPA: hypothetical protein VHI72_14175 [Hyphomicrobiaceae bacterium]|jgi:hypothetical protein|nr:hypothetical protein [Hyphomicrobiaceae bacterium]
MRFPFAWHHAMAFARAGRLGEPAQDAKRAVEAGNLAAAFDPDLRRDISDRMVPHSK